LVVTSQQWSVLGGKEKKGIPRGSDLSEIAHQFADEVGGHGAFSQTTRYNWRGLDEGEEWVGKTNGPREQEAR